MREERVEGSHIRPKLIKNDFDKSDSRTERKDKFQPTKAPGPWLEICIKKGVWLAAIHFPILLGTENWEGPLKNDLEKTISFRNCLFSLYSEGSATLKRSKTLRNTR